MKKLIFSLCTIFVIDMAWAQDEGGTLSGDNYLATNFIALSLVYSDFNYEEPGVMTENGGNGGFQLEAGYHPLEWLTIGAEASYWDGRLNYDGATFGGTPITVMTRDYASDVKYFLHAIYSPVVFSIGFAKRFWYNDLIISYRRRTEYKYYPIRLTYFVGEFYYQFEYDLWNEGLNISHMSDVGGGRSDVRLPQPDGVGYGLEVGWLMSASPEVKFFFRVHQWSVEDSETAFDGVSNLVEPENNTLTYTLGAGLIL